MTTSLESALLRIEGQKARIAALGKNIDERDERIDALTKALREIISADDTGPMMFEPQPNGPSQALGGSKGKFAAIARSALSLAGVK